MVKVRKRENLCSREKTKHCQSGNKETKYTPKLDMSSREDEILKYKLLSNIPKKILFQNVLTSLKEEKK